MTTENVRMTEIASTKEKTVKKQTLHLVALALCLLAAVVLFACSSTVTTAETADDETAAEVIAVETTPIFTEPTDDPDVLRAIEYGLIPVELMSGWDDSATFTEFCDLMQNVISDLDISILSEWDSFTSIAKTSDKEMLVGDLIAPLYYAASLLGYGENPEGNWWEVFYANPTDWNWQGEISTYELFPQSNEISPFIDNYDNPSPMEYSTGGYFWCIAQYSPASGDPVLRVDDAALTENLTWQECVAVTVRFYESLLPPADTESCEQAQEILSQAENWKSDFFENKQEVQYTGTAYYVSNSGDDSNDGRTPETAWATIEKAMNARLRSGDAILLNCGDTWHVKLSGKDGLMTDALLLKSWITLGSYGTGERPVLRGDAQDASDPANWTLWLDQDGVKIWQFYRDTRDCSVIVFNDGESWADKIWPCWNGVDYVNADGSLFDPAVALDEDLTFCSLLDIAGEPLDTDIKDGSYTGPLYLRCDSGNPAVLFDEIAVPQTPLGLWLTSDSTAIGLDLRYFTCCAATLDAYEGYSGMSLMDSEISWCGGLIDSYQGSGSVLSSFGAGGAIQASGTDITISNNYIHDCGPMTFIISIHGEKPKLYAFKNQLITGNLTEYCSAVLHWADLTKQDNPEADGFLSNLEFSNNMVLYSGMGWVHHLILQVDQSHSSYFSAMEDLMGASNNDGIYIKDNVFYLCERALIRYTDYLSDSDQCANARPIFSGNIYAQYKNGWLAEWNGELLALNGTNVWNILGDQTGKVYEIN